MRWQVNGLLSRRHRLTQARSNLPLHVPLPLPAPPALAVAVAAALAPSLRRFSWRSSCRCTASSEQGWQRFQIVDMGAAGSGLSTVAVLPASQPNCGSHLQQPTIAAASFRQLRMGSSQLQHQAV